ncbi:MAG: hypothetical protein KA314_01405 [Chloroflexi bacterium]|nr:hypothetical protein [Chloroflexota bacterium]MBP8054464.1 hypothetical protein [Chloroflexota bacterium]
MAKLSNRNNILLGLVFILVIIAVILALRNQAWTRISDLFTPEATPTPALEAVKFIPFGSDANGLFLEVPETWIAREELTGVTVATSERVLSIESFDDLQQDAVLVIIPGEIDVLEFQAGEAFTGRDPLSLLELYVNLLRKEGQEYTGVVPPQTFANGNQMGAKMILQSPQTDTTLEIIMAAIVNEEAGYVAFVSTAATTEMAATYRSTFDAILDTIQVGPAAALQ